MLLLLRKKIRCLLVTLGLTFCLFEQAYAQIISVGFDKSVIQCLFDGFGCLQIGIPIVDAFFGRGVKTPQYTREMACRDYRDRWCGSLQGGQQRSGYFECRQAKMNFYKHSAEKKGEWPPAIHPDYPRNPVGQRPVLVYFIELEEKITQRGEDPYFTCNAKQRQLFIEALCGDFIDWRYQPYETIDCGYKY